jgi:hypothetical protein
VNTWENMSTSASAIEIKESSNYDDCKANYDIEDRIKRCVEMIKNQNHPEFNIEGVQYTLFSTPTARRVKSFIESYGV